MKRIPGMLLPLAVAATVLASPAPPSPSTPPPKGAVFLVIDADGSAVGLARPPARSAPTPRPDALLGGLLDRFAVVKPHRTGPDAPPGLQMFVLVAPMNGQVGVQAVGSF